uniref:BZIP domain-containing protein n=1 Tax=Setaria italica TaxID=4555 RepID=K4AKE4_SETIT
MVSSASKSSGDERPSGAPGDPSPGAGTTAPLQGHAEWAASMQAYYAAGGQPYAWHAAQGRADQHMMAAAAAAAAGAAPPYGAPVPFPVSFHPAYYAHAAMATGVPYTAGEPVAAAEGKNKRKSSGAPSVGSASGRYHFISCNCSGIGTILVDCEPSQAATTQDAAAETQSASKRRSAAKLSVSTPETAAISETRPNLNIGMDLWSNSPVKAETSGQGEINAAASSQHDITLSQMDERELKRERRKQSNRESARRSRLRKQQECEELAQKVTDLTAINGALRSELDQLKKACEDMKAENSQLMGEMEQSEAPSVVTTLSIQIDTSKAHHGNNDQHHNKNNNDNKG